MTDGRDIHVTNTAITTTPGTTATVILFDSTAHVGTGVTLTNRRLMPNIKRIRMRVFADQIVTVFCEGLGRQSTTWRPINGAGAGEATTANVEFERDFFVGEQDDFRIRVTTPAGAITVWDVSVRLSTDQALGQ